MVACEWECHLLRTHGSNKTIRGNSVTKFNGFYQVWENFCHLVDPCERGKVTHCLATNPVTSFEAAGEFNRVSRDARDDELLGNSTGFQGMLKMMISLLVWLVMWELISSVRRLFHSLSFWSHKSFILVHPTLAMAHPSLSPLMPKGWPIKLVTRGLLKIGCLRTSACDVGSIFAKHVLSFSQDPRMFF
jgi:hypothetical protein